MVNGQAGALTRLLGGLPDLLPQLEAAYKDIYAHPELSMQENRTPTMAALLGC